MRFDPFSLYQSFIPTSMVAGFLKQLLKEERKQKEAYRGKERKVCSDLHFHMNTVFTCEAFQYYSSKSVKAPRAKPKMHKEKNAPMNKSKNKFCKTKTTKA